MPMEFQERPEDMQEERLVAARKRSRRICVAASVVLAVMVLLLAAVGLWLQKKESNPLFVAGLVPVRTAGSNGFWGYLNDEGNFAIEPQYENAKPFSKNGLAAVCLDGHWGYIDQQGNVAVKLQFDAVPCWLK